jgi:signal transduction histidine kinase
MMLRRRVLVTGLAAAVPAAVVLTLTIEHLRAGDMALALDRVVRSQVNDQVRERCESDPNWFLTGPLEGRPAGGVFVERYPGELPPRPKVTNPPFQLFAYDDRFTGSSAGAPPFPPEFRRALRSGQEATMAYATADGTGAQMAIPTGWIGGPCMYLLGRMLPPPDQRLQRGLVAGGAFGLCFAVAWLVSLPTVRRVRRLSQDMRASVGAGYATVAPDNLRDELSALTFMFNDGATELHERKRRLDDLDESLRRFVASTDEEIARPLAALGGALGAAELGQASAADSVRASLVLADELTERVENLIAAARLRLAGSALASVPVALDAVAARVVERHRARAHGLEVAIDAAVPPQTVTIRGDEALVERVVSNLVDNAIRYNHSGGRVRVELSENASQRTFLLRVTDSGTELNDDRFAAVTSVKRFRGDEYRNRRPNTRGLGLSVAQEAVDRMGLTLAFERPAEGGLAAAVTGPTA